MIRRLLAATLVCLPACAGKAVRVATVPAPLDSTVSAPPESTVPRSLVAVRGRSRTLVVSDTESTQDSAADDALLTSLADSVPGDSLPDLAVPAGALDVDDYADQPRVRYYLDYFSGKAHDRFQIWLSRMPRFQDYIRARLAEAGLPGDMIYLALIESGFSADAVSRSRAVGMWQFMAGTARLYGLRMDSWVDERRDPIKATDAASRDLAQLVARFNSPYLAAAAYNAGAGRVARGLDVIGSPSGPDDAFFSLADTHLILEETKDYVPELIAAALIARQPDHFGFTVPDSVPPFPLDSVVVDGGTGLDLIATLADTTLSAMRALNPQLLRAVTPPGVSYAVRVPGGTADTVAARYGRLTPAARRAIVAVQVAGGESLTAIARKYDVSVGRIREVNRVARGRVRVPNGTTLYVPVTTGIPLAVLREPDPPIDGRIIMRRYVVARSETLSGIARHFGTTVASLRAANGLRSSDVLRAGQELIIATSGDESTHVVRAGETVSGIAASFGTSQSALIALNGLDKNGRIYVGQMLRIPGS